MPLDPADYRLRKIEEFRGSCRTFAGLWRSLVIRAAWTRVADRDMAVQVHASLEVADPADIVPPPHDPSLDGYTAVFEVLPASEIDRVLGEVQEGTLTVGGKALALGGFNGNEFRLIDSVDGAFCTRDRQHWMLGDAAGIYLHVRNGYLHQATQQRLHAGDMKERWNALPAPFDDIDDVLARYFDLPPADSFRNDVFMTLRAGVPIRFAPATGYDGKRLRIEVAAPETAELREIAVGLIANDGESRRAVTLPSWKRRRSGHAVRRIIRAKDLHTYKLFLVYKGVCLDLKADSNPALRPTNPVLEVQHLFLPDPDFARRALRGESKKDKGGDFERAVGWLLGACGLTPLVFAGLGRETDLVAVLPERRIAVCVECTIGMPDNKNKLAKLYERSENLKAKLPDFEVMRVVATATSDIPPDQIKVATEHGTAVLTGADLERLQTMARANATASEALAFIRSRVPRASALDEAFGAAMRPPWTA